jgi:hypothetical protein
MKTKLIIIAALIMTAFASCNKDDNDSIDTEKPQISASIDGASPANAATFYFGDNLPIKLLLTDNEELGSFSVNIHNNFDHHSHSTEEEEEEHHHKEGEEHHHHDGEDGDAFQFTQDYTIPAGSKEYTVDTQIPLPVKSSDGDEYDGGDYHFMLTVTDKAGFSTFKAFEIKILQR